MKAKTALKRWRSGFCGLGNPADSHAQCRGGAGVLVCCCDCHQMAEQIETLTHDQALVDFLAEQQWIRMNRNRGPVVYAEVTEDDKRACRALVVPVLDDVRAWDRCPVPHCIAVRGHQGLHPVAATLPEPRRVS